jgi:exopolyphosphatase/guanosine-5'-triphosphate,3'-diphosphate pyrophosphatase
MLDTSYGERAKLQISDHHPIRLASIDIGSNAIRLFVGQGSKSGRIRVLEDQRASVRLGKDAFSSGYIRPVTQQELERALKRFFVICEKLHVHRILAVGTSALRDSSNSRKVLKQVKERTGIDVKVINGQREASLLHRAVNHAVDIKHRNALLIDMGGGSLEVVLSRRGKLDRKTSLPLGTVRLLSHLKRSPSYEEIAHWVRTPLYRLRIQLLGQKQNPLHLMIGTGGNLRALGKLCHRLGLSRSRSHFGRNDLETLVLKLFSMTLNERIKRFQLKRDRADVILPAAVVVLEMMRIFEISEITVPNVGIKNGLFWETMERIYSAKRKVSR